METSGPPWLGWRTLHWIGENKRLLMSSSSSRLGNRDSTPKGRVKRCLTLTSFTPAPIIAYRCLTLASWNTWPRSNYSRERNRHPEQYDSLVHDVPGTTL